MSVLAENNPAVADGGNSDCMPPGTSDSNVSGGAVIHVPNIVWAVGLLMGVNGSRVPNCNGAGVAMSCNNTSANMWIGGIGATAVTVNINVVVIGRLVLVLDYNSSPVLSLVLPI